MLFLYWRFCTCFVLNGPSFSCWRQRVSADRLSVYASFCVTHLLKAFCVYGAPSEQTNPRSGFISVFVLPLVGCHGAYDHASDLCASSFSFQHAKAVSLFASPLLNLLIVKRWYDDVVFEATRLAPTSIGPSPFVQWPPWTHLSLTCVAVAARSAPTLPDSPIAYMRGGCSWFVFPPLPQRTGLTYRLHAWRL